MLEKNQYNMLEKMHKNMIHSISETVLVNIVGVQKCEWIQIHTVKYILNVNRMCFAQKALYLNLIFGQPYQTQF